MDFYVQNKENITAKVQKFIDDECGCRRGSKGIQCSDQFTVKTVCLICTTAWKCSTQNWTSLCWQTFKLSRRLKKLAKKDKEVHLTALCTTLNPSVRICFSTPMESAKASRL